jgi:hypothetical protein
VAFFAVFRQKRKDVAGRYLDIVVHNRGSLGVPSDDRAPAPILTVLAAQLAVRA